MDSTGSSTRSTAPAAANTSLQNPMSSRAPSSASKRKAPEMLAEFKCLYCPRSFPTTRGRSEHHTKKHMERHVGQNKKRKTVILEADVPQVSVPSLVPLLGSPYYYLDGQIYEWAGEGFVAVEFELPSTSLAAPAPAADGNGRTEDGVHPERQQDMPEVNQDETIDGIDLTLRL